MSGLVHRFVALAALVALACACGALSGTPTAAIPTPSESATPAGPAVTKLNLSCRLPVSSPNAPMDGNAKDGTVGTGGFVTFPSGVFTIDPNSLATYDGPMRRWLPVPRSWVSPDETRFAYVVNTPETVVHVVNLRANTEALIRVAVPVGILSFEAEGIYLTQVVLNSDAPPHGIALLDPDSGYMKTLTHQHAIDDTAFITVRSGYAYSGGGGAGYETIPTDGPPPYWNELFKTPVTMVGSGFGPLIYARDSQLRLIGFDGGSQPVVSAESRTTYSIYTAGSLAYQSGPPQFSGNPGDPSNPGGSALGDGPAIWFGSASGLIWHYPGHQAPFAAVARTPVSHAVIAGPCS